MSNQVRICLSWLRKMVAAVVVVVGVSLTAPTLAQTLELSQPISVVAFDPRSSQLDADGRDQLTAAAKWLHDHPWRLIVIEGYGDRPGRPTANLAVAQDRVDAVRSALIDLGADPRRIVAASYDNTTSDDKRDAAGEVLVRGTLRDFRDLVAAQSAPSL